MFDWKGAQSSKLAASKDNIIGLFKAQSTKRKREAPEQDHHTTATPPQSPAKQAFIKTEHRDSQEQETNLERMKEEVDVTEEAEGGGKAAQGNPNCFARMMAQAASPTKPKNKKTKKSANSKPPTKKARKDLNDDSKNQSKIGSFFSHTAKAN